MVLLITFLREQLAIVGDDADARAVRDRVGGFRELRQTLQRDRVVPAEIVDLKRSGAVRTSAGTGSVCVRHTVDRIDEI